MHDDVMGIIVEEDKRSYLPCSIKDLLADSETILLFLSFLSSSDLLTLKKVSSNFKALNFSFLPLEQKDYLISKAVTWLLDEIQRAGNDQIFAPAGVMGWYPFFEFIVLAYNPKLPATYDLNSFMQERRERKIKHDYRNVLAARDQNLVLTPIEYKKIHNPEEVLQKIIMGLRQTISFLTSAEDLRETKFYALQELRKECFSDSDFFPSENIKKEVYQSHIRKQKERKKTKEINNPLAVLQILILAGLHVTAIGSFYHSLRALIDVFLLTRLSKKIDDLHDYLFEARDALVASKLLHKACSYQQLFIKEEKTLSTIAENRNEQKERPSSTISPEIKSQFPTDFAVEEKERKVDESEDIDLEMQAEYKEEELTSLIFTGSSQTDPNTFKRSRSPIVNSDEFSDAKKNSICERVRCIIL